MSAVTDGARTRRRPPAFRHVTVSRVVAMTPRMVRITFGGPGLEGFGVKEPGASVRVLLPSPGATELVMPEWDGNEFLLPDGSRPTLRTFTPRHVRPPDLELDVDIVIHDAGAAAAWAGATARGDPAAISGPGRGYAIDSEASSFLLAGDETALPAIAQLLEVLPSGKPVEVHIEVAQPDARLTLPDHPGATIEWHDLPEDSSPGDTLVVAVAAAGFEPGIRVWAAGHAAAMQRIRRHLRAERGLARAHATVRGYWKGSAGSR